MTSKELITLLQTYPKKTTVLICDADTGWLIGLTHVGVHDFEDGEKCVTLHGDYQNVYSQNNTVVGDSYGEI